MAECSGVEVVLPKETQVVLGKNRGLDVWHSGEIIARDSCVSYGSGPTTAMTEGNAASKMIP